MANDAKLIFKFCAMCSRPLAKNTNALYKLATFNPMRSYASYK